MSKPRFVLLILIAAGILIQIATLYGSVHPRSPIGDPAITLFIIYMLAVPIVVWKLVGERLLKTVLICTWALYLLMLAIGAYRMYQD
jgi:hypothetical protein